MTHEVTGYIRNKVTAAPYSGIQVSIVTDDEAETLILPGGDYGASSNPTTTDANGLFSWTAELSPGPIKARAEVPGGAEIRVRSGREVMQAGMLFIGDLPVLFQALSTGVIKGFGDDFLVEAVVGQRKVRVNTGAAITAGVLFSLDTDREIPIDVNTSLVTRKDLVVLQIHVAGQYLGRQQIVVVKGTVNDTEPTLNTDPNLLQVPLAMSTIPQNATSVTVADRRPYAGPTALPDDIVSIASLSDEVLGLFDDSVGIGRYFKDTNFLGSTTQTITKASGASQITLASAAITVPAGTWIIESEMTIHNCYCTVNSGTLRFRLTGNGAPVAPDDTTRPIRFSGNVFRPASCSSRLIVSPTVSTVYTVNLTVQYEGNGDPVNIAGGILSIKAY